MIKNGNTVGLIKALNHKDPAVQIKVIDALGELSDKRAIEPLATIVNQSTSDAIRDHSITALKKIDGPRVVELFINHLSDKSLWIRRKAADALKDLGWFPDTAELQAVYHVARNEWDKCMAIGQQAVDVLIPILDDETVDLTPIIQVLGKIGDSRVIYPLISLFSRTKQRITTLETSFNAFPTQYRYIEEERIKKISGKKNLLRTIIVALAEYKTTKVIEFLVQNMNVCPNESRAALEKMGPMIVPELINCLKSGKIQLDPYYIGELLDMIGEMRDHRAYEFLTNIIQNQSWEAAHKIKAIDALGKLGDSQAGELLLSILQGQSIDFKCSAAIALGKIGEYRAIKPLIVFLGDKSINPRKRACAAKALRNLRAQSAVEPLILALNETGGTPETQKGMLLAQDFCVLREAAAEALGEIGDKTAIKPLQDALHAEDDRQIDYIKLSFEEVRRAIQKAISKLSAVQ